MPCPRAANDPPPHGAPDGRIHRIKHTGGVELLRRDGSRVWHRRFDTRFTGAGVVDSNGTLYLQGEDRYLRALDADGEVQWHYPLENGDVDLVMGEDGLLYVLVRAEDRPHVALYAFRTSAAGPWVPKGADGDDFAPFLSVASSGESGCGGLTPLHQAAWHGEPEQIEALLAEGEDPERRDDAGRTPFELVFGHRGTEWNVAVVGTPAHQRLWTPEADARALDGFLVGAATQGTLDGVRWALAKGADVNAIDNGGRTALVHALWLDRSPELIDTLLDAGADAEKVTDRGTTALIAAARHQPASRIEALLEAGGDPRAANEDGLTALHWAALHNPDPAVIEVLVDAGAEVEALTEDNRSTPLLLAAARNHRPVVEALLDAGAEVDNGGEGSVGFTPLTRAVGRQDEDAPAVARLLIERGADIEHRMQDGWRPLMAAAQEGGVATIEVLVEAGARVNAHRRGWTALTSAVQDRELPIVDALLEAGAGTGVRVRGGTLLHVAVQEGYPEVVERLLELGLDPRAEREDGTTPLHMAAQFRTSESGPRVVDKLLDAGAEVDARLESGHTPLILAAQTNSAAMVKHLIAAGADVNAWSEEGVTPLLKAADGQGPAVIEALLDAGADPTHGKETDPSTLLHRDGEVVAVRRARYGVTACDIASGNLEDLAPNGKLWRTSALERLCEPVLGGEDSE